MKTTAIICEFDPLHKGHEHLIREARRAGAECIVCVMSGAFCQRAEPSSIGKHTRAHAALSAGADIVLELPFPYSCASAEFFALGAMSVIGGLGCVDTLAFGCESGDAAMLEEAAVRMCSAEFAAQYELDSSEHTSIGTAALIEGCYVKLWGDTDIFRGANNVLALEYIKAAHRAGMHLHYHAVKRQGAAHNSSEDAGGFSSASLIREKLREGQRDVRRHLPESTHDIIEKELTTLRSMPALARAERAILAHFRLAEETPCTAESGGGLGHRIADAARRARSYEQMMTFAKTKKYTDARIRRAIIFAMCGVRDVDLHRTPTYTTLLAANERGRALLSSCKKTRRIEVLSSPSALSTLPESSAREILLRERAESLRSICTDEIGEHDATLRTPPVILK